jgi:hypothetical protein
VLRATLLTGVLVLSGCNRPPVNPVEDLAGGRDVSAYVLSSLRGSRDGEHLNVQAVYTSGPSALQVSLRFTVTPPAKLELGTWNGFGAEGTVAERSVTFLGGQSGPPSIGGRFDLLASNGRPLFRINIPVQPLHNPL